MGLALSGAGAGAGAGTASGAGSRRAGGGVRGTSAAGVGSAAGAGVRAGAELGASNGSSGADLAAGVAAFFLARATLARGVGEPGAASPAPPGAEASGGAAFLGLGMRSSFGIGGWITLQAGPSRWGLRQDTPFESRAGELVQTSAGAATGSLGREQKPSWAPPQGGSCHGLGRFPPRAGAGTGARSGRRTRFGSSRQRESRGQLADA